jgi:hypothetical protein
MGVEILNSSSVYLLTYLLMELTALPEKLPTAQPFTKFPATYQIIEMHSI